MKRIDTAIVFLLMLSFAGCYHSNAERQLRHREYISQLRQIACDVVESESSIVKDAQDTASLLNTIRNEEPNIVASPTTGDIDATAYQWEYRFANNGIGHPSSFSITLEYAVRNKEARLNVGEVRLWYFKLTDSGTRISRLVIVRPHSVEYETSLENGKTEKQSVQRDTVLLKKP